MDDIRQDSRVTSKPEPGVSMHSRQEHKFNFGVSVEVTQKNQSTFNPGYTATIKCILPHSCIYYMTYSYRIKSVSLGDVALPG